MKSEYYRFTLLFCHINIQWLKWIDSADLIDISCNYREISADLSIFKDWTRCTSAHYDWTWRMLDQLHVLSRKLHKQLRWIGWSYFIFCLFLCNSYGLGSDCSEKIIRWKYLIPFFKKTVARFFESSIWGLQRDQAVKIHTYPETAYFRAKTRDISNEIWMIFQFLDVR